MESGKRAGCLRHDPLIRCPGCGGSVCGRCGGCACGFSYRSEAGVLRVLSRDDDFYEGAYNAQVHFDEASLSRPSGRLILPFINYGYLKMILETVPPGSRVLELGSGGGMRLAGERYRVTALDLSFSSLRATPPSYAHRVQADATEVDFLPGRFDAVVGSCFFEHLDPERKGILLGKVREWLRPGGVIVLLFDTESGNPFFRWLQRDAALYHRCFVEHDGHFGLAPVSTNRALFREHGFAEVRGIGLNRTVQHLPVYTWIEPYGDSRRVLAVVSRLFGRLGQSVALSRGFTAGLHLWDLTAGRLFPLDWSRLYLGCWRRP